MQLAVALLIIGFVLMFFEVLLPGMVLGACAVLSLFASVAVADLTLSASSSDQGLVPDANIVLGGSGASRTVTVTPASNQSGSATITLTVSDGTASSTDTFVLTVDAVNDVPTISDVTKGGMQLAVALLIIGFVLMFFEVLLPGMVLGACAVLSLFASVAVAYSNTDHGNIFLIIALVSLAVFAVGFVYWFPKSYIGRNLISTSAVGDLGIDLSELINKTGSAYTNLRPSGTAVIGDDRVDVVTEGTFVEKDRPVKVVAVEGQRVVVREVEFLT